MRIGLPTRLPIPSPPVRRILFALWCLCALASIGVEAAGTWRGYESWQMHGLFDRAGLWDDYDESGALVVVRLAGARDAAAIDHPFMVTAVDGQPVTPGTDHDRLAHLLDGPEGSIVHLSLIDSSGLRIDRTARRLDANRDLSQTPGLNALDVVIRPLLGWIVVIVSVATGVLLWRRRSDDPVSVTLAFAFVLSTFSYDQGAAFFSWQDKLVLEDFLDSAAWLLLIEMILVFPDGRFRPRWSRWLFLLVPLPIVTYHVLEVADALTPSILQVMLLSKFVTIAVTALVLLIRYRRTPPGEERQQIKWGVLGFGLGLVFMLVSMGIGQIQAGLSPGHPALVALSVVSGSVIAAGTIAIPLGVLMSQLKLRLNDADKAIGRSFSFAAIGLTIGVVFAICTTAVNQLVTGVLGVSNPFASSGASALIAAMVFVPARARMNSWTEKTFQPALVRLRALPVRLQQAAATLDPEPLAAQAIDAIVKGIGATRAAVMVAEDKGQILLAAEDGRGMEIDAQTAHDSPSVSADFPMQLDLADSGGPVGMLLVGPRSDGASYRADERLALKCVREPLAHALRQALARTRRETALTSAIAALESRVAGIERQHKRDEPPPLGAVSGT